MRTTSREYLGFTLVEVLVSIAILTMILVMATQITISARDTSLTSQSYLDAERQAGRVYEQLHRDIESMLIRNDLPWRFEQLEGNDECAFFTQRDGYAVGDGGVTDRRISLASYRVVNGALQRGSIGMQFGDKGASGGIEDGFLVMRKDLSPPDPPEENFQTLSDGVVRFELGFLSREEGASNTLRGLPANLEDLRAIVVTLVTIDSKARRVLSDEQLKAIEALFPEPVDGIKAGEEWNEIADDILAKGRGLPESALKRVRVTHRIFPIDS